MSKPLLMIVDDEPDIAELVSVVAGQVGYDVRIASTAIEAQNICRESTPSAIITDIVMPDMDANELLQWLVEQGSAVPILLMSGYGQRYLSSAETLGWARGAPIVGSIEKPFSLTELEQHLRHLLSPEYVWSEDMSVGVDVLDADHKALFSILHHLRSDLGKKDEVEVIGKTLTNLHDYTGYHFTLEEELMEACGYPGLHAHRKAHRKISEKIEGYMNTISSSGDASITNELIDYVGSWLHVHIGGMDKAYESWMSARQNPDIEALQTMHSNAVNVSKRFLLNSGNANDLAP